ncbi:cupin domain-containing protein [Amycolatopsis sp. NPDC004378]
MDTLLSLISPQPVHEFLGDIYGQAWCHYPGSPDRFQHLAGWETLNRFLATQWFEDPRIRVTRAGTLVPPDRYTEQIGRTAGQPYRRLVINRLYTELRGGATLVVDRIDQAHEPLRELAALLQKELRVRVFSNLFASWEAVPGFGTHWDDHDVFIIQLAGVKRWKIFGETRRSPLPYDVARNPRPENDPLAEIDVAPGDVLYVPSGWWHSVSTLKGPSLHVSVGVTPDVGIDLLNWLVNRAKEHEVFRRRIPRHADDAEQAAYLEKAAEVWDSLWRSEDVLDDFFAYSDGIGRGIPYFSLPDVGDTNNVLARASHDVVPLVPRAAMTPTPDGKGFVFAALGRQWSFPVAVKDVFDAIFGGDPKTVSGILDAAPTLSHRQVADVIFELMKAGVVVLR